MTKIEQLIDDYKLIVSGEPWYGTGFSTTMNQIPYASVNFKVKGMSHTIGEMVVHVINWRNYAIQKIKGNKDFHIEIDSDLDWMSLEQISEEHWVTLLDILDKSFDELIAELGQKPDSWLESEVPGKKHTQEYLTKGIIQQDVYHLAQIRYILGMSGS